MTKYQKECSGLYLLQNCHTLLAFRHMDSSPPYFSELLHTYHCTNPQNCWKSPKVTLNLLETDLSNTKQLKSETLRFFLQIWNFLSSFKKNLKSHLFKKCFELLVCIAPLLHSLRIEWMCMHACVYTLMNTSMCMCVFRKFCMLWRVYHCVTHTVCALGRWKWR